jgi:hypothetical protein
LNLISVYNQIISRAKSLNRTRKNGRFEKHHIIPRCKGGTDDKENLVLLTPKEHYICHHILHKHYSDDKYLFLAYHLMTFSNKQNLQKITAKQYEELRVKNSIYQSGENNPNYKNKQNLSGKRNHRSKQVEICGNLYESISIASKELNIPKTTLRRWISKKKLNYTYVEK